MSEIILNRNLLSSQARIQVPWVKVTIGDYTFGIFDEVTKSWGRTTDGFYNSYEVQFPQYIKQLEVKKINGQVNTYTLNINYPITQFDDPNFFEKVFSSVSNTRKIIFTYGDAETPAYVYKNEEAIITGVQQSFNLQSSAIDYTVTAVSSAALSVDGTITVIGTGNGVKAKPSEKIKELFRNNTSLQNTFTGMTVAKLDELIDSGDMEVELETKCNISAIDYINYLVGCMIPEGSVPGLSKEIYILTIHDDSITSADSTLSKNGPYFEVRKVSTIMERSDAYEIDIGINTSTIVRSFQIEKNENFSIYYDYQNLAHPEKYKRVLSADGTWEYEYAPTSMMRNNKLGSISPEDRVWWTKATQFPINATIQIQGLIRPATLMQYVRLNVIFPGGNKHVSSGLYIVTRQIDNIGPNGYATNLGLTRIKGDMDKIV
jgi:hypothetical protein